MAAVSRQDSQEALPSLSWPDESDKRFECCRSYQLLEFRVWQQPFLTQFYQDFSMAHMQTRCFIAQIWIFCWFLGHICLELMKEHFQDTEGYIPTTEVVGNRLVQLCLQDWSGVWVDSCLTSAWFNFLRPGMQIKAIDLHQLCLIECLQRRLNWYRTTVSCGVMYWWF